MIEYLSSEKSWEPLENLIIVEGKKYNIRTVKPFRIVSDGLTLFPQDRTLTTYILEVPFNSGKCKLTVLDNQKEIQAYNLYIYPDESKLILKDYLSMMSDLLNTNNLGITMNISEPREELRAHKHLNQIALVEAKFLLLNSCFDALIKVIKEVCNQPFKSREKIYKKYPSYRTDKLDQSAVEWISVNSSKCYEKSIKFPTYFKTHFHQPIYDIYENKVLVRILKGIAGVCNQVHKRHNNRNAKSMEQTILREISNSELKWVNDSITLSLNKTHRIKANRNASLLYNLYLLLKNINYKMDKSYYQLFSIPVSKTYKLYEMWCFIKLIELLKANQLTESHINIYTVYNLKENCIDIVHGLKSAVNLKNGSKLFYQRRFEKGGGEFRTYTSDLIPDFCLIKEDQIIVLDSKYRVGNNIDGALSELHKYRDGIVKGESTDRAVISTFVLTPGVSNRPVVHNQDFYDKWKMGAITINPSNSIALETFLKEKAGDD